MTGRQCKLGFYGFEVERLEKHGEVLLGLAYLQMAAVRFRTRFLVALFSSGWREVFGFRGRDYLGEIGTHIA